MKRIHSTWSAWRGVALAFFAWASLWTAAVAAPIPQAPSGWVTDTAAFLSPAALRTLDARLADYERTTGHQIVVWIGSGIGQEPLEEWAVKTFAAWRLGRKGIDDGLALFVLSEERKLAIEVGYGLEERVPDAVAARVIHEVMAPKLRAGERDAAITAGVDALLAAIEGRPLPPAAGPAPPPHRGGILEWLGLGAFALFLLILFIFKPSWALWFLARILSSKGRRGGGFGGGGFGGGGGRSGGGGARGAW